MASPIAIGLNLQTVKALGIAVPAIAFAVADELSNEQLLVVSAPDVVDGARPPGDESP